MWADGKRIMTVEGLKGPNGELSPIQKAFIEEAAVQCGFCTPGLIMSAVEIVGTGREVQPGGAEKADIRASLPLYRL